MEYPDLLQNAAETFSEEKSGADCLPNCFIHVYRNLNPFWDKEALLRVKRATVRWASPTEVSHQAHLAMVHHPTESARPAVVITGKGGFSSSRIVNYLKANTAPSSVRFVGWRAQGTLGHTIQIRGPHGGHVEPDGLRYEI